MADNVCCMFSDPVPGHAVDNCDLECLASDKWSHREETVYRCRRCGNYVLHTYVENNAYDWDNPGVDEDYIPIEEPEKVDEKYTVQATRINDAPRIGARYYENDWPRISWGFYNVT